MNWPLHLSKDSEVKARVQQKLKLVNTRAIVTMVIMMVNRLQLSWKKEQLCDLLQYGAFAFSQCVS